MEEDDELNNENLEVENLIDKKDEINQRDLSSKSGFRGRLKNIIPNFMNNIFGDRQGKKTGFDKMEFKLPLKTKLILFSVCAVLILLVIIVIIIGDDSSKNISKYRNDSINDLGINDNSTPIQKTALQLYKSYDSLIGFNDEQLKKIYDNFLKNQDSTNKYIINSAKKELGSSILTDGKFDYNSKKTLYEHIQRTEKYNFNNIFWRLYTHTEDNKVINTEKNEELGLLVPEKEDEETLITLLRTTAPYLFNNDIPLGMLCGLVSYSSSSMKNSSVSERFVYQLIKEAMTKMTVNKYILESVKFNTVHEVYDIVKYRQVDRFVGRAIRNEKGEITGMAVDYVGTVSKDVLDSKPGPEIDEKRESEKTFSYDTYWYVAKAKTYDANIVNNFDYRKYIDQEVEDIVNPDVNTFLYADPFERVIEGAKPGTPGGLADGQTIDVTSEYTAEVGAYNHYEKEWQDKCIPKSTDNNILKFDNVVEFNTSEDEEYKDISLKTDKKLIDKEIFQYGASEIKDYEEKDNTVLYGISLIDCFDANKGVYTKYLTSTNAATSTYRGLGRYKLKEGYKQVKYLLKSLINRDKENGNNNVVPFVYGSSLGFEVTNISVGGAINDFVSGMDLLKQYIRYWEGSGEQPVTTNSEGVECYTAYRDSGGDLTVGYGVNLDGNPADKRKLEELVGQIDSGTLVPVDLVDAIEDEKINYYYNIAKTKSNGLDLKEYQIHALTSLEYNNIKVDRIVDYYRNPSYWNEETDDKYEQVYEKYKDNETAVSQIEGEADYSRGLYSNWMALNVHDQKGNKLNGLVRRRKSEYVLFSLGYYSPLQKFYSAGGGIAPNGANLVPNGQVDEAACKELQTWFESNIFGGTTSAEGDLRRWKNGKKGGFNSEYSKYGTGSSLYQCPWWSRLRANMFLEANGLSLLTGPTDDGIGAAKKAADQLHITYYGPNQMDQLKPNSIISYNTGKSAGHVAYVEAVSQDSYVISHCGSGKYWHGIQIVPKTPNGLNMPVVGFCCLEEAIK